MSRYENRLRIHDEVNHFLTRKNFGHWTREKKLKLPTFCLYRVRIRQPEKLIYKSIGPSSRLSRFIKHEFRKSGMEQPTRDDIILTLHVFPLDLLCDMHYLRKQTIKAEKGDKDSYQLILSTLLWEKWR